MTSTAESPPPAARRPYFVNAWVDGTVMGGLSILAFVLLWSLGDAVEARTVQRLSLVLLFAANFPHFSATNYRLYRNTANVRQFPVTATVLPFLVALGVAAAIHYPALVAPYLVTLYLAWSPYHFSGQSVGLTMVYSRRCGFPIGRWERLALSSFIFGTFLVLYLDSGVGARIAAPGSGDELSYYGIPFLNLGFPGWMSQAAEALMWTGGVVFSIFVARWCVAERRWPPLILLIPAIAQFFWFVLGPRAAPATFLAFVSFFHAIQYLFVAWAVQLKERAGEGEVLPSPEFVRGESLRWGAFNLVGGVFLFLLLPAIVAQFTELDTLLVFGIVYAGVQIHHFFVDGVIWKLRNARVASPLMVDLAELTGAEARPS